MDQCRSDQLDAAQHESEGSRRGEAASEEGEIDDGTHGGSGAKMPPLQQNGGDPRPKPSRNHLGWLEDLRLASS